MENTKILSAAFLDILFDGRNKEYGAYQLRKTYNKRVATALIVTGSLLLLLFLGNVLANALNKNDIGNRPVEQEIILAHVTEPPIKEPLGIPPPKQITTPPPVEMKQFTPPVIMQDDKVKEDDLPPENTELNDAVIGLADVDGIKDPGIVAPPPESGTGDVIVPKAPVEDYEKTFIKVEDPATFPGGVDGWRRYLERYLVYPEAAQENETQGVVQVEMIVNKYGKITEVNALNNPGNGLAEEAVRVIKVGPDWKPAEQNGQKVAYKFIQTITFRM